MIPLGEWSIDEQLISCDLSRFRNFDGHRDLGASIHYVRRGWFSALGRFVDLSEMEAEAFVCKYN